MQKHSTMEAVLTLTTGIIYSSFCFKVLSSLWSYNSNEIIANALPRSCGLWKSQVCFLNWSTRHIYLDVKSDIINQRQYFLTTGKMPIFLAPKRMLKPQTDISRRENGAHVRIRIRPAWQARGINRDGSTRETLSWCRLQIIIIMMIMTMIMIMVINYNKDSGLGFSYIWYLTLNSLPIYSSVPP